MTPRRLVDHYHRMPEKVRLSVTAVIGAGLSLVTYEIIFFLNPIEPKATTSWALAFIVNIARQHALHRWLSFIHPTRYWPSLFRAYVMYSGTAVATTFLNYWLTTSFALNHRLVWLLCMLTTALISLLLLKRYVFRHDHVPV